jgi:hypothetical protein
VRCDVFNILGRKVAVLIEQVLPAGRHEVVWNTKDESGESVASGVYFYRLHAGNYCETKKMLLLK